MVQQYKDLPNTMVGFQVSGNVTKIEFSAVILPAIDELIRRTGKLNYLFMFDDTLTNYGFGTWLEDAVMEFNNIQVWSRAAIVTGPHFRPFMNDVFQRIMRGEVKMFFFTDFNDAILWVSSANATNMSDDALQSESETRHQLFSPYVIHKEN